MADYLSRYSNGSDMVEDFEVPAPFISNRSLRMMETDAETKDPLVLSLADSGENDSDYTELLKFIIGEVNGINKDSSYMDCKPLIPFLSVTDLGGGKRIITKDSLEVLIPVAEIKRLLNLLHSTHLSGCVRVSSLGQTSDLT